jgi:hypothetical protein
VSPPDSIKLMRGSKGIWNNQKNRLFLSYNPQKRPFRTVRPFFGLLFLSYQKRRKSENKTSIINMAVLSLRTLNGTEIKFRLYSDEAPLTCDAFTKILPLEITLLHARTSGEEIWTPDGPELKIAIENATVNIESGEIGIGPMHPRNKIAKCLVISYGQAKLFDYANIFGQVVTADVDKLKDLGNKIWTEGKQSVYLTIEA